MKFPDLWRVYPVYPVSLHSCWAPPSSPPRSTALWTSPRTSLSEAAAAEGAGQCQMLSVLDHGWYLDPCKHGGVLKWGTPKSSKKYSIFVLKQPWWRLWGSPIFEETRVKRKPCTMTWFDMTWSCRDCRKPSHSRPVSLLLTVARITLRRTNAEKKEWKLAAASHQVYDGFTPQVIHFKIISIWVFFINHPAIAVPSSMETMETPCAFQPRRGPKNHPAAIFCPQDWGGKWIRWYNHLSNQTNTLSIRYVWLHCIAALHYVPLRCVALTWHDNCIHITWITSHYITLQTCMYTFHILPHPSTKYSFSIFVCASQDVFCLQKPLAAVPQKPTGCHGLVLFMETQFTREVCSSGWKDYSEHKYTWMFCYRTTWKYKDGKKQVKHVFSMFFHQTHIIKHRFFASHPFQKCRFRPTSFFFLAAALSGCGAAASQAQKMLGYPLVI